MKKVVVGLSGGVDSSVAAYLLKEKGYEVIGVTMQVWQDDKASNSKAIEDAQNVAKALSIPHFVVDFRKVFREKVIDYFVDEYMHARTPNPCIVCNRFIKWEALLDYADKIGAEYIATGHYAKIVQLENGRYSLLQSEGNAKDQTYALYRLTQEQLARTIMPVGEYTKEQIRYIANKAGIPVANKADSQEICFIPDDDYAKYIEEYTGNTFEKGNFVDKDGNILGKHNGIIHYTIGQRKGLNLAMGRPVFVTDIKVLENEVVIGEAEDVFSDTLEARDVNYMSIADLKEPIKATAKIRYSHKPVACTVTKLDEDTIKVVFDEPVRAITKGQAVVLYDNNYVLLGGTIV
ncbi:MAG: tRNA 2-thiouridine(34) synthase MnmA [Lachnospiraceae bacterium]|nr:tRNA 2-thiouridine(34) synthase MnmA [Lachnospiraceae bacterium]